MPQRDEIRLLLVDDDPAVIRAYGGALTRQLQSVTVETASKCKDAAERVKGGGLDVIKGDIHG